MDSTKKDIFRRLDLTKTKLDKKAANQTHLMVIFILCIPIIIAIYLALQFNWEDLNPFIYIATLIYYLGTYLYFFFTQKKWSPIDFYSSSSEEKKNKIYKKYNFDLDYYSRLKLEIDNSDEQLQTN